MSTNTIYSKKICQKCGTEHYKSGIFCSRSCANSRSHSKETKEKISNKLKTDPSSHQKNAIISFKCKQCGVIFNKTKYSRKIICSKECYSLNLKGKCGGARENSGWSKTGYYKGIYCGSTYELVYVMYRLTNNLPVARYDGYIVYNDNKKYFPDFIEDYTIIEIKGYETETVIAKTNACIEQGYDIKVLYKDDLQYMFDWYKDEYGNKPIHENYDDYKPKYTYICNYCNNEFTSDKKKNSEIKYCSRKCSGYGVKIKTRS